MKKVNGGNVFSNSMQYMTQSLCLLTGSLRCFILHRTASSSRSIWLVGIEQKEIMEY